jgi:MtN3 and saliva related transmembrane protein
MNFALTDSLGYLAALCTTSAFVPQVLHTLRTRDVSGISFGMYSIFCTGITLWLAYGLLIGATPVVIANVVTLALASWILAMKIRIERRRLG